MSNSWLNLSNKLLYIIEGVDPTGRKFNGIYNAEDAKYIVASDRLNRIIAVKKSS